ncbi:MULTISPECIES: DNA polymerase III subunit delta [Anaeromyxobacter]|uniref:DNA polymerase III subunit delta n=1 Tax=Anaeromyxobacter TaxID=161492 RepID=UPI001F570C11|nr:MULTISPECIES: DNA polymerase III subunit delta [unclassified Anaeromyxobacter]
MAGGRGTAPRGAAGATLETCLADVRGGAPRPVYLLDGDAFLALRAARELASALVPEAQRALNLVELDPATSPAEVAAELSTGGLFGGGKVVLLHEPAFLTSKEDAEDAFRRAKDQWAKGAQRDAARRLLALAAKAGWSSKDLAPDRGIDHAALAADLGVPEGAYDAAFVEGAARFAAERELKVSKDDASALDAALERGFARGHVLVVAAGKVDGRLPLVKRLAAAGRRVTIQLEKEGTWDAQRLVLGPVLESLLAGTGKRVDRAGEARLAALVGEDARTLASEVAKLAAYVGDRKVIGAEDVDAVVTRVASDPFFALGNAVEARDLPQALGVLERAIADGGSPFMLLGSLASTVRRMIVERERARRAVGDRRIGSAREWEAEVFPLVPEDEAKGKKPYGFWMKYQAALRFSRAELLDGLAALAEADVAMKSGQDGRIRLERVLLGLLASGHIERSHP